ncbi:DUF3703 domain-containing protein [Pseudomonas aeruginosa]|nr:DUF3703 domain-containing protein [Pseudomonas aeruginosa]EKT8023043.1 DUF3703 domain-containing protein [Pseudomonas aeruginosa]EKU2105292.1 DUF3703 domain-containing protein [Pseudomonas aeruginosa]EKU4787149.1 DUF3703 domain-containing protein [Pseudomonas aeruginosa]EKU5006249.1 DUF3703 domain-containing protein [Pseudomonas aeruginosa]
MDYGPQLVYPFRSRPAAANACAAGYTILPTSHSCASRALRLLAKRSRVAWRAHESGRVVAHCYLGLHPHLRSHAAMLGLAWRTRKVAEIAARRSSGSRWLLWATPSVARRLKTSEPRAFA